MLYMIVIPILLTFVPWLVVRRVFATARSQQISYRESAPYLWTAAALWVGGHLLPTIPLTSETKTFGLHFTGGVVAGILFLFVVKAYRIRFTLWWQPLTALYFFVSGLGVANELFELFLNKTGLLVFVVHANDTWWDLLANTIGAFVTFGVAWVFQRLCGQPQPANKTDSPAT